MPFLKIFLLFVADPFFFFFLFTVGRLGRFRCLRLGPIWLCRPVLLRTILFRRRLQARLCQRPREDAGKLLVTIFQKKKKRKLTWLNYSTGLFWCKIKLKLCSQFNQNSLPHHLYIFVQFICGEQVYRGPNKDYGKDYGKGYDGAFAPWGFYVTQPEDNKPYGKGY